VIVSNPTISTDSEPNPSPELSERLDLEHPAVRLVDEL